MTSDLLSQIHALHGAHRRGSDGPRYPEALQDLITLYAQPLRDQGMTWSTIAEELPISTTTLRKWTLRAEGCRGSMVPVTVVDAEPVEADTDGRLRLTTPAGFQLTGLSLEQAAQLMAHLG